MSAAAGGAAPRTHPMATASLVLGVIGLVPCLAWSGLLAIGFGIAARREIARHPESLAGKSRATAGIVLGTLTLSAVALLIVIGLAAGGA